jgi:hypothetical protein
MPRTLAPAALTVRNALTRNRLLPAGDDPPSSYLTFTMIVRATCLIRNPKTSLADPAGSDRTAAGRIESLTPRRLSSPSPHWNFKNISRRRHLGRSTAICIRD